MFCHYNQNNWGIIEDLFTLRPKDSLFMLHCLGSNTNVQKAQVEVALQFIADRVQREEEKEGKER